jgi:hypothetical protein
MERGLVLHVTVHVLMTAIKCDSAYNILHNIGSLYIDFGLIWIAFASYSVTRTIFR